MNVGILPYKNINTKLTSVYGDAQPFGFNGNVIYNYVHIPLDNLNLGVKNQIVSKDILGLGSFGNSYNNISGNIGQFLLNSFGTSGLYTSGLSHQDFYPDFAEGIFGYNTNKRNNWSPNELVYLVDTTMNFNSSLVTIFNFNTTANFPAKSYEIDWGDGTRSEHPRNVGGVLNSIYMNHIYRKHGQYIVRVKAEDALNLGIGVTSYSGPAPDANNGTTIGILSFGNVIINGSLISLQGSNFNIRYFPNTIGRITSLNGFCNFKLVQQSFNYRNMESWDTSNVTDMGAIFNNNTSVPASINLSRWNVSNVTTFSAATIPLYGDYSHWNLNKVTNMSSGPFNGNFIASGWSFASGCNFTTAFNNIILNNSYFPNWTFGPNSNCTSMFQSCNLTNISGLDTWNTSGITNMTNMFNTATFNANLSGWNTSNVTTMNGMFNNCASFSGSGLQNWNLARLNSSTSLTNFAAGCNFPTNQYDLILNTWNNNKSSGVNGIGDWRTDLNVHFGNSSFSSAGSGARTALRQYGWTITDASGTGGPIV